MNEVSVNVFRALPLKKGSDNFSAFFPLPKIEGKGWLYDRPWLGREGLEVPVKAITGTP